MSAFLIFFIKESDDDSFCDLDIGILLIERERAMWTSLQHLSPASLKIVIEGEVMIGNIQDLQKAMSIMFGHTVRRHWPKTEATDIEKSACNVKRCQLYCKKVLAFFFATPVKTLSDQ